MDLSASMAFGSLEYNKADYGRTLAGTLGSFLHGQGDAVGLLRFASESGSLVPVSRGGSQMARWWSLLSAGPSGNGTSLGKALTEAQRAMRRPGLVVVVSDFLAHPDCWKEQLAILSAGRHQVALFEVLDPQEIEFSYHGDTRFEMLEGGSVVDVDALSVREGYLERMRMHREWVATLAASEGSILFEARTDRPFEPLLRNALQRLSKLRGRGLGSGVSR